MHAPHHNAADVTRPSPRQLSLEELDILNRKCHHLHDEEIATSVTRLCRKIAQFFGRQQPDGEHQPAR